MERVINYSKSNLHEQSEQAYRMEMYERLSEIERKKMSLRAQKAMRFKEKEEKREKVISAVKGFSIGFGSMAVMIGAFIVMA